MRLNAIMAVVSVSCVVAVVGGARVHSLSHARHGGGAGGFNNSRSVLSGELVDNEVVSGSDASALELAAPAQLLLADLVETPAGPQGDDPAGPPPPPPAPTFPGPPLFILGKGPSAASPKPPPPVSPQPPPPPQDPPQSLKAAPVLVAALDSTPPPPSPPVTQDPPAVIPATVVIPDPIVTPSPPPPGPPPAPPPAPLVQPARPAIAAQVAAVPEPATWGMMVLGFGMAAAALRRRRAARRYHGPGRARSTEAGGPTTCFPGCMIIPLGKSAWCSPSGR